ncbi:hypothetical protein [uncultured Muriicola sp.]|uniref:hypothetical protein n=1 Tax=uncultured Muriicola sp. TaxID=1583102 RepID=UPI00262534C9|nr:hypothetical protein [uncultured Muriicola sp.]
MNITNKIIIVVLIGFLSSCSTLKDPVNNNYRIELNSENLSILNGIYKRSSISDTINKKHHCPNNLFHSLFLRPGTFLWNNNSGKDFVEIKVIDKKRIKVTLTINDKIVKENTLKGKIVKNTFEFNRRSFIFPLVFMNFYEDRKTRIGSLQNGNLSIDTATESVGNFFIFPWSGGAYYGDNLEFEKVK